MIESDPQRTNLRASLRTGEWDHREDEEKRTRAGTFGEPGQMKPLAGTDRSFYGFMLACPGCGRVSAIRAGKPKPAESPSWEITAGGRDDIGHLTLQPSLHSSGCCGWHGYLTNGTFTIC